eukprot:m51a1_g13871 hypothetical protein (543) ;mRNA; f:626865-628593
MEEIRDHTLGDPSLDSPHPLGPPDLKRARTASPRPACEPSPTDAQPPRLAGPDDASAGVPPLLQLPPELHLEIALWLAPRDLCSLFRTCRVLSRVNCEALWASLCRRDVPPAPLALCATHAGRRHPLAWLPRYRLLACHAPATLLLTSMRTRELHGLTYENTIGAFSCVAADRPLLSASSEAARAVPAAEPGLLRGGVEYFEMSVVRQTQSHNRCVCIGLAHQSFVAHHSSSNYLGWTANTVAFHSDDGTPLPQCISVPGGPYNAGDTVGMLVDWEAPWLGLTKNGRLIFIAQTAPGLDSESLRLDWYPAVGTMLRGDCVTLNLGARPFVFDVPAFLEHRHDAPEFYGVEKAHCNRQPYGGQPLPVNGVPLPAPMGPVDQEIQDALDLVQNELQALHELLGGDLLQMVHEAAAAHLQQQQQQHHDELDGLDQENEDEDEDDDEPEAAEPPDENHDEAPQAGFPLHPPVDADENGNQEDEDDDDGLWQQIDHQIEQLGPVAAGFHLGHAHTLSDTESDGEPDPGSDVEAEPGQSSGTRDLLNG